MKRRAMTAALLLWAGAARADGVPDLRLDHAPVVVEDLSMRAAPALETGAAERGAAEGAAASAASSGAAAGADVSAAGPTASTEFEMFPTSARDLEERVVFNLNVGYGLDSSPLSGDPNRDGFFPGEVTDPDGRRFNETRQYALGDAVLGTNGILLPSLNTYFLSRFQFDTEGASAFAGLNNVYDESDGRDIHVKAAYAEVDGFGEEGTALGNLYLRGGRQFRFGATNYVANFDGLTLSYDDPGYEVSGFFGRRVSVFFGDSPGILGGAGAVLRGDELFGVPVDLRADYLFFDGGDTGDLDGDGNEDVDPSRQFMETEARVKLGSSRVYLRGRFVDPGELSDEGAGLGRLGAQLRQPLGKKLLLVAEAEQKFAREVAFDYISPIPVDVVNVAQQLGIGLAQPEDATRLTVRANYMPTRAFELYGFARANLVSGDSKSGFNQSWQELGAAASSRFAERITASGQYKLRVHDLDGQANMAGSEFDDTAGSGVSSLHELSAEARYSLGYQNMTAALGGYYRVYDFQSPYAEVATDARAGGRADVDYWVTERARVKAAGEIAEPSPTFAAELGVLTSVRLLAEVMF